MKDKRKVYHCIYRRTVKILNACQLKKLFDKGFFIKEVYHGPAWASATYFYLGKKTINDKKRIC